MTKRRQTPAIAGYPRTPRPVAALRECGAEYSETLGLRRRGRENPSCRDGPRLSSLWYRPDGSCRRQAVREPWHCRATKAFAAPAARKNQAGAWNRVRKLRTLSSLKVRPARPLAAKEYHRMARLAPRKCRKAEGMRSETAQRLHHACRDPVE